jgi:hypothetical protein
MKYIQTLLIVFASMLINTGSYAQATQNVTGKVIDDASKAPLTGAIVVLLNAESSIGTATDTEGYFRLTGVPIGRQAFRISFTVMRTG